MADDDQTTDGQERQQAPPLSLVSMGHPVAAQVTRQPGPNGQPGIVLRIEHAVGSTVVMLPPEVARRLGELLTSEGSRAALHVAPADLLTKLPHGGDDRG